jgi:hypothetical protein
MERSTVNKLALTAISAVVLGFALTAFAAPSPINIEGRLYRVRRGEWSVTVETSDGQESITFGEQTAASSINGQRFAQMQLDIMQHPEAFGLTMADVISMNSPTPTANA